MAQTQSVTHENADLTNCDREQIHIPGRIQAFGCLLSVTSDWIVNHASQNAAAFLGLKTDALVGHPLTSFLRLEAVHDIRSRLQMLVGPDSVERLFAVSAVDENQMFDVAIHRSGRSIILEFEHADQSGLDYMGYIRPMIDRMGKAETIEQLSKIAALQIRAITGMDRVMVYRFAKDDSGEVIAEAKLAKMESFLNLRYPASDIPKQARALYERNHLRIIGDVAHEGVEVAPAIGPEGTPLDLSMSTTRAVSPIHLEYLKNMGVYASMSISILRRGKLWGLFACHHNAPIVLSFKMRTALELFAQLYAYVLDQKENDLEQQQVLRSRILHDQVMSQLAEGSTITENFDDIVHAIEGNIPHDGVVGWLDGNFQAIGMTPSEDEFMALVPFLNTTGASKAFATDNISKLHKPAEDYIERAAGLLALPVSRTPRDYIVLFRREVAKSVQWAGNPDKPVEIGPNGIRLTPRKSFAAWQEIKRGQSSEWSEQEIQTAESLRVTLLEVVLRMADSNLRERARAQEHQELLIAELNHRVRNILNLIKGLIKQSSGGANDIDSFTKTIGGRVHALARAHDQITKENWSPAPLYELIETEVSAYLQDQNERVVIKGPDVLLEPGAFTTLSLVIHELITNSVKYGALTDRRGTVEILIEQQADQALIIKWREIGGPPVQATTRRGFGTTIIERSIPFELQGKADVRFDVSGLRAEFLIPSNHVAQFKNHEAKQVVEKPQDTSEKQDLSNVLVVEDNVIIALDAEMIMQNLGAQNITVCSTVHSALNEVDSQQFSFALLDINLGSETSERIALALQAKGTPFAFATGYGELKEFKHQFPEAKVVQKPYDEAAVAAVLTV